MSRWWPGLAGLLALAVAAPEQPAEEARSHVVMRYECSSQIGRREVTLFGNGTIRVRDGLKTSPVMTLGELGGEELEGFLTRLRAEDLREVPKQLSGVSGAWVERCVLELDLGAGPPQRFGFGRYDSLPLALSRVLGIAEDLAARVDATARLEHLPPDYVARVGDVLKRADGGLFEIRFETSDKRGWELRGVDSPITLYILKDALSREFVALSARRGRDGKLEPADGAQ